MQEEDFFSSRIRVTYFSEIPSFPEIPSEGKDRYRHERFQVLILKVFMHHPGNKDHWRYRVASLRAGLQKKSRHSGGGIPAGDTSWRQNS
jgi:hypothetical protein